MTTQNKIKIGLALNYIAGVVDEANFQKIEHKLKEVEKIIEEEPVTEEEPDKE